MQSGSPRSLVATRLMPSESAFRPSARAKRLTVLPYRSPVSGSQQRNGSEITMPGPDLRSTAALSGRGATPSRTDADAIREPAEDALVHMPHTSIRFRDCDCSLRWNIFSSQPRLVLRSKITKCPSLASHRSM